MLREVRRAHKTGQPILVGTTSVETSELIADALQELNISCKVRKQQHFTCFLLFHPPCPLLMLTYPKNPQPIHLKVLNARPENIETESQVVAQAGRIGAVTVATNMAGRGTDILLGGNPSLMARIKLKMALVSENVMNALAGQMDGQRPTIIIHLLPYI